MNKHLTIVLTLAAIAASVPAVKADTIKFSVAPTNQKTAVLANSGGLIAATAVNANMGNMTVTDESNGHTLSLSNADIYIATGNALLFNLGGTNLVADYKLGPGTNIPAVEVLSPGCTGTLGKAKDVCLWGILNGDNYDAKKGGTGSFEGDFTLKWVEPGILSALGSPPNWLSDAYDGLDSAGNKIIGRSMDGYVSEASVVLTTVPEPGSLLLLGTGLAGLAAAAFRKVKAARR